MEAAATGALVAFASLWGTLTRLGLSGLNTYDGQSIAPIIWAQAVGCLVMGWMTYPRNKATMERWYKPAFTMVTTGYCGSTTSYSTWVFGVFQAFSNNLHYNRHGLHNVMDALTQTAATIGMSFAGFWAGRTLGGLVRLAYLEEALSHITRRSHSIPRVDTSSTLEQGEKTQRTRYLHLASVALGTAFWIGAILLCALYSPFRKVSFTLVLSPLGALVRWQLAKLNKPLGQAPLVWYSPRGWPVGTLTANLVAITILCVVYTAQYVGYETGPASRGAYTANACDALYAVQNGFCGTLSTISTLIVELSLMRPPRAAFAHLFFSWAMGILISILLVGAPWWAIGMQGGCAAPVP